MNTKSVITNVYRNIVRNGLQCLHNYGILCPEHEEKESESNDRYGRIYDTRRDCKGHQEVRGYSHTTSSTRENARIQDRRFMDSEQERFRGLANPAKQFQAQRQKIKPAWWLATIKQFTAVRLSLSEPEKLARDNPKINLPTFSITKVAQQRNGWLYKNVGTR